MAKVCTDKLLHIWSYWLSLLKQAASSQTAKTLGFFLLAFFVSSCTIKKIVLSFFLFPLHISEVSRCYSLLDCTRNWPARFLKGTNNGSFKLPCKGTFCFHPRAKPSDFQDNSEDVYASLTLLLEPWGSQSSHREQLPATPQPSAVKTVTSLGLFQ